MVHTSGSGSDPFTSGGHYIGIRGITSEGKWLLADSNGTSPGGYQQNGKKNTLEKEWDPKDVVDAGLRLGNIKAIKK